MGDDIKYIYNTLAVMYKEFATTYDMKRYNNQAADLCKKYKERPELLSFCQNLVVTWAPIINQLKEQNRNGGAA